MSVQEAQVLTDTFENHGLHPVAAKEAIKVVESGLSVAGMEAAMAYANPFPDKQIEPFCVPTGAKNVIPVVIRGQYPVSKPAGLTAGSNWGIAIIEHPILWPAANPSDLVRNYTTPGTEPSAAIAGTASGSLFSCFAFDDTVTEIDMVGLTASGGNSASIPIGLPSTKLPGSDVVKIIAQAIEVENTTPQLTRGGSVTCAKFEVTNGSTILNNGTYDRPYKWMSAWPYRYADLAASPNAVSWGAEKGVYMPNTLRSQKPCTFQSTSFVPSVVARADPVTVQNPVRLLGGGATSVIDTGFNVKVAVFRGLDPSSTLLLNTIVYAETQQDATNALYPLSRSEPPLDNKYLAFISEMDGKMPVATIFKGNALGSWFNDVCSVVSNIGEAVGSVLPGPFGMIASGIGKAAKFAGNLNAGMAGGDSPDPYADSIMKKVGNRDYNIPYAADEVEAGTCKLSEFPKNVQKEIRLLMRERRAAGIGLAGWDPNGPRPKMQQQMRAAAAAVPVNAGPKQARRYHSPDFIGPLLPFQKRKTHVASGFVGPLRPGESRKKKVFRKAPGKTIQDKNFTFAAYKAWLKNQQNKKGK